MYNRYVPQPDGSFRRNRIQDRQQRPPAKPSCPAPEPPKPAPCPPPSCGPQTEPLKERPCQKSSHGGGFLSNLLPKDFDTGDLIVVLLLLLLAGDCEEDRSHALLTLALYMFM